MAKGPNTVKFMNRMIDEYRAGKLNDKQVCSSIRRITRLNERQWAYGETRIALKMFNKMPMNYMCKEPCAPSIEEALIEQEEQDMLDLFLLEVKERYPDWQERLSKPCTKEYDKWIRDIRCDLLSGKYGNGMRRYSEDVWLHKRKLYRRH